jgi:lambda repressor-like predicted transcriptional regulator
MNREERRAAIETGAALVTQEGMSLRQASASVGIPHVTLHSAIARLAEQPEHQKLAGERLAAAHVTIAQRAADRLYGLIDELPYAELIRVYGVASDKVAIYQGWGSRSQDGGGIGAGAAEAVARILASLDGRALTLSVSRTEPNVELEAIDHEARVG